MKTRHIPKTDMHVHLEGTITPKMVQKLAAKNGLTVKAGLISGDGAGYSWKDDGTPQNALLSFVHAYDDATVVMKSADDYAEITYDYLSRAAAEHCIYAEPIISADHATLVGIDYPDMLDGITRGYERAKKEHGIEARFIAAGVRHYGLDKIMAAAETYAAHPHPLVTGFTVAGDENALTFADIAPAYNVAAPPFRTGHAGEAAGPDSVAAAFNHLGIRRFGHMVRAMEDADLIETLKNAGAVPEICVSSNLCMKVFPDAAHHPLRRFFDAGFKVVLGSDDPPFFRTSIGREYDIAQQAFGFNDDELATLTRNGVEEAFIAETAVRDKLMDRLRKNRL